MTSNNLFEGEEPSAVTREDVVRAQVCLGNLQDESRREGELERFLGVLKPLLLSIIARRSSDLRFLPPDAVYDVLVFMEEECLERLPHYDPSKASPSTYFYRVGRSAFQKYLKANPPPGVLPRKGKTPPPVVVPLQSFHSPSPPSILLEDLGPIAVLYYRWKVDREAIASLAKEEGVSVSFLRKEFRKFEEWARERF